MRKAWGSEILPGGGVRFRLWAPREEGIAVVVDGGETPMTQDDAGWFEATVASAHAGSVYAFHLADGMRVADPAARAQKDDIHGPSLVVDPDAYQWKNVDWAGRPWEETVVYELHLGTLTPEGTFAAAIERLPHLAELGITMIELMPVAQFAGTRGWGYDGVLLYAPHNVYGTPDEMKRFIDAAHGLGMSVVLDVIYNHFGPDGNYLPRYAPDFFHPERHTPWGAAIAYEKKPVRDFFIDNAVYWLTEYRLDGLRLDAIDHIVEEGDKPSLLVDIAQHARAAVRDRPVHLTTEDNRNITRLHERTPSGGVELFTAEWNDDFHNVVHVIATGEAEAYYADFQEDPIGKLARCLAEGFIYQGERTAAGDRGARGTPSAHLPPAAFLDFVQNHDQVGNRALGDRLVTLADENMVRALLAVLLLSPHIPLLFMGEEWGETNPFLFFTDFHGELADAVRDGRRKEFASFSSFDDRIESEESIPDPNDRETFLASKLDWEKTSTEKGRAWMAFLGDLLKTRSRHIVPIIRSAGANAGEILRADKGIVAVDWRAGNRLLQMRVNLGDEAQDAPAVHGETIFTLAGEGAAPESDSLAPCSVIVAIAGQTADERGVR